MNTKTLFASLAFALISANTLAVEATQAPVPVTSLERTEIRAEIAGSDFVGAFAANETYGSFAQVKLHGHSALSRSDVVAEMAMPKWQALIAAKSATYNAFGRAATQATSVAATSSDAVFAGRIHLLDFVGD